MTDDADTMNALAASAEEADAGEAFIVDIDGFEGPLHVLLDLARRQKVDLRRISVLDLAEQYLGFIEDAKRQRIDLAADYLLMAAWLAFIKSKLLLPAPERPGDDEPSGEAMAARLAFRLRRLDAMRDAAKALQAGPILNNVVFLRGAPERPKVVKRRDYDTTVWHMAQAFGAIRSRQAEAAPHVIESQLVLPLEAARDELRHLAPDLTDWRSIEDIRADMAPRTADLPPRSVTASVFSAALELARDGDLDLRQSAAFTPLFVRAARSEPTGAAL